MAHERFGGVSPWIIALVSTVFALALETTRVVSVHPPETVAPKEAAWTMTLTTSGGLSGRGEGGALLTARGDIIVYHPSNTFNRDAVMPDSECRTKLSVDDVREVEQLIASANPSLWRAEYLEKYFAACAECYIYKLELRHQAGRPLYSASWSAADVGSLPPDLAKLHQAIRAMRFKYTAAFMLDEQGRDQPLCRSSDAR